MLGYEWANSAAMLLSYDPSEAAVQEQHHHPRHQMLPLYDRLDLAGALFPPAPPAPMPVAAATAEAACYPLHHYGTLSLPPATPAAQAAMRIGLNLGVRTYFSSSPDGELMRLGRNLYRRSGDRDAGDGVAAGVLGGGGAASCRARCQAEGCRADLTRAKHYHRRHKVCEYHSKAAAVVAHGLTQRFCQQCSRFHVLAEFDHGKRSCRKRLADHNRRRRKTQTLPPLLPLPSSQSHDDSAQAAPADDSPPKLAAEPSVTPQAAASAEGAPPGTCDEAPAAAAADPLAAPASSTWMALGRCLLSPEGVPGGNSSSSSTSSSSCSSSSSSVLQHLGDFRRVPMSIWDAGVDHGHNGHVQAD